VGRGPSAAGSRLVSRVMRGTSPRPDTKWQIKLEYMSNMHVDADFEGSVSSSSGLRSKTTGRKSTPKVAESKKNVEGKIAMSKI
jgi:hypothetical protein